MSEESDNNIKTNEEVVEDLVKQFRDSQFIVEPSSTDGTDNVENNTVKEQCNASNLDTDDLKEEQCNEKESNEESEDEDARKNDELQLSDAEKEKRRTEAVQLKNQGNEEFKGKNYTESMETYTKGLRLCPFKYNEDRAILYANRAASKIQLGDKPSAIEDCTKAIKLNDKYVRAYLRRAKLYEETDKLDESLEDYKKIAELDPGNYDAIVAQQRLPPLINERNEKLKTEMFGKLKDLGNLFLRPFGLSTENFKLQQDPNSGGYSINFQQNPTQ